MHFIIFSLILLFPSSDGTHLIIVNNCKFPIWSAILCSSGHPNPADGGFSLPFGQQAVIEPPQWWSGRIWARQGCIFDRLEKGTCQTGNCGEQLRCSGVSGQPPVTVVDMILGNQANPVHYCDVSLVDGFNLPVSMVPLDGDAGCGTAGCEVDLNGVCPPELAVWSSG